MIILGYKVAGPKSELFHIQNHKHYFSVHRVGSLSEFLQKTRTLNGLLPENDDKIDNDVEVNRNTKEYW